MPFGIGFGELILVLAILGVPLVLFLLAIKLISKMFGAARNPREAESGRLAAELHQAQLRIEELEAKVERVEEKAAFTQELLEKPQAGQ